MGLLDLSPELRCRIFEIILTRPCPVDILFEKKRSSKYDLQYRCQASNDSSTDGCGYLECTKKICRPGRMNASTRNNRWICVGPLFSVGILRVCRQSHLEAINILYTGNTFILDAVSLEEIPLSTANLHRISSFQLNILHLHSEQSLHNYRQIAMSFQGNPYLHLTIASNSGSEALLAGLTKCIELMGPVKACALHLSPYNHAKALGVRLANQQTTKMFPRYNDLPAEIRRRILGYTDLAQDYHVQSGKLYFNPQCCRLCSKTLFPCCCNTVPQARLRIVPGSRFSSRCVCKFDPRPLLKLSKQFRAEAVEVLFSRSNQFKFAGLIKHHLAFLCDIKPYSVHLRNISLRIGEADMQKWHKGEDIGWNEFVGFLVSHCKLSLLSLTIVGAYFYNLDDDDDELPDDEGWKHHTAYYQSFVPGLRRLIDKGLMVLDLQFLHHLNPMTEEYRRLVMTGKLKSEHL